jgi:hypothetical protein
MENSVDLKNIEKSGIRDFFVCNGSNYVCSTPVTWKLEQNKSLVELHRKPAALPKYLAVSRKRTMRGWSLPSRCDS